MPRVTSLLFLSLLACAPSIAAPLLRIMPLGASIAEGGAPHFSFRPYLYARLVAAGYTARDIDFIGRRNDSSTTSDPHHQAQGGNKILDYISPSSGPTKYLGNLLIPGNIPDIVLIQCGSNDIADPPATIIQRMETMVDLLRAANPEVVILYATLTNASGSSYAAVSALMPAMAIRKSSAASPVVLVDVNSGSQTIATDDLADGLHLKATGAEKMATSFYHALIPYLTPRKGPGTFAWSATAEVHTDQSSPDMNHDASVDFIVGIGEGKTKQGYLRFDLSGVSGTITSARLEFPYPRQVDSSALPIELRSVSAIGWSENTLTYNRLPAPGALLARFKPANTPLVTADLSAHVAAQKNGPFAFALVPTSDSRMVLGSAEDYAVPRLVLTVK